MNRRFRPIASRSLCLAAVVLAAAPRLADAEHSTYISLGDSIAFGVGENESPSDISNGDRGYVSAFADYLGSVDGHRPRVLNLALSGESTASFFLYDRTNRIDPTGSSIDRNTNYAGLSTVPTQSARFEAAVDAERAAGRTISTVTVSLGSNDLILLAQSPAFLAATEPAQQVMLMNTLQGVYARYGELVSSVRSLAPEAELYLLSTYNPFRGTSEMAEVADVAVPWLNSVIKGVADKGHARFVDIARAFVDHELQYTYIADGNVHPTPEGYAAISRDLIAAVPEPGSVTLLGFGALAVLGYVRGRRRRAA